MIFRHMVGGGADKMRMEKVSEEKPVAVAIYPPQIPHVIM